MANDFANDLAGALVDVLGENVVKEACSIQMPCCVNMIQMTKSLLSHKKRYACITEHASRNSHECSSFRRRKNVNLNNTRNVEWHETIGLVDDGDDDSDGDDDFSTLTVEDVYLRHCQPRRPSSSIVVYIFSSCSLTIVFCILSNYSRLMRVHCTTIRRRARYDDDEEERTRRRRGRGRGRPPRRFSPSSSSPDVVVVD
jgi:hypothetical protein